MADKIIGLDVRMWRHPGIGRYIRELVPRLLVASNGLRFALLGYAGDRRKIPTDAQTHFREVRAPVYGPWEQLEFPARCKDLDLLHVPHFNAPLFYPGRLVVTIHDLIYWHRPETFRARAGKPYLGLLLNYIARKASGVLAVSEATKRDLLETFRAFSEDKITVTHEAAASIFKPDENPEKLKRIKSRYGLKNPFILFVGTLKPHKNVAMLVRAIRQLKDTKQLPHDLVLVGKMDLRYKELQDLLPNAPFVKHLGELPDEDLPFLYRAGEILVLPSLCEGFGLPALEAMACGTPVIGSRTSSLPEILGEEGAFFPPGDIDALASLIYNVLSDIKLREKLSQYGLERARLFSWEETARQTINLYKKILHS